MNRAKHFCAVPNCKELTKETYCEKHKENQKDKEKQWDKKRGTASQRGYGYRWAKYSKMFLSKPENQFCKLPIDERCAVVSQCVDHIDPPNGPEDPLFWDSRNHQPACIHCNSVKGHRKQVGNFEFGEKKKEAREG